MKEKTVNCNNKMFDAFKVLRTNEEEVLRRLIDGDGINEQVVTSKDCDESVLRYLQKMDYLEICRVNRPLGKSTEFYVMLTENGKQYFRDKEIFADESNKIKRHNIIKIIAYSLAYLITTSIAVAALIVSIIK